MKKVVIYTDGACSFNPGPGGWGTVLIYGDIEKKLSGFKDNTTNNQMEMLAVIKALKQLKESCEVDIYSDSAYVVNAFLKGWVGDWEKRGWKTADKKDVKNLDLWQELINLVNKHKVTWHKVKGHADDKYNNICDKLARGEVDKYLSKLQKKIDEN